MREFFILVAVLAPVFVLGLIQRSGVDTPTWIRVIGLSWFVVGSLIIGWYDGWVKRVLVGILIFIPLMGLFSWWSGAVPGGWPTAINITLILASIALLVVTGLLTGWFTEAREDLRRAFGRNAQHAKDV